MEDFDERRTRVAVGDDVWVVVRPVGRLRNGPMVWDFHFSRDVFGMGESEVDFVLDPSDPETGRRLEELNLVWAEPEQERQILATRLEP